ncbi:hypothetical protein KIPB_014140, partial [Kipferlia bialata]|eukprot:g14140.t1
MTWTTVTNSVTSTSSTLAAALPTCETMALAFTLLDGDGAAIPDSLDGVTVEWYGNTEPETVFDSP